MCYCWPASHRSHCLLNGLRQRKHIIGRWHHGILQLTDGIGRQYPLKIGGGQAEGALRGFAWRSLLHQGKELLVVQVELVSNIVQTVGNLKMKLHLDVVGLGKHLDKEIGDILDTLILGVRLLLAFQGNNWRGAPLVRQDI